MNATFSIKTFLPKGILDVSKTERALRMDINTSLKPVIRKGLVFNKSSHWSLFSVEKIRLSNRDKKRSIKKNNSLFRLVKSIFHNVRTFRK